MTCIEFLNSLCCNCCTIDVGGYIIAGLSAAKSLVLMILSVMMAVLAISLSKVNVQETTEKPKVSSFELKYDKKLNQTEYEAAMRGNFLKQM